MHYVISGASGFLGRALRARLAARGHRVTRLVRTTPRSPEESTWQPYSGSVDTAVLADADVVVNLSGASIGGIWTKAYRQQIRDSRVATTRTLATALAGLPSPPVFVTQSGVGFYGEGHGAEPLDEDAPPGHGFLAEVVSAWEAAAEPAERSGVRVVRLRSGVVLDRSGGAFPLMALPFRCGLGGRLGSGQQYFSTLALIDWLCAVEFVIGQPQCRGAYNLTLPSPTTNAELTTALGAALRRPTPLPVPAFALRALLGGLSGELLNSLHVRPRRLLEAGFSFTAPTVSELASIACSKAPTT